MSSLVQEIQRDATDPDVGVSLLLRKALIVATKLKVTDETHWIRSELSGYDRELDEIPGYRELRGLPQVHNPYHGFIPFQMPAAVQDIICKVPCGYSAAEIESLLQNSDGMIRLGFSTKATEFLLKSMEVQMQPSMILSASSFVRILDTVRNRVLQWALDLEEAGILGDGMSFSTTEVQAAQQVTNIVNNIGTMNNSQLQQLSSGGQSFKLEQCREDLSSLLVTIKSAAASTAQATQVNVDADTVLVQLQSKEPKRGIIEESLKSLREVLESAAGSALGDQLPKLVALMVGLGLS